MKHHTGVTDLRGLLKSHSEIRERAKEKYEKETRPGICAESRENKRN